MPRFAGALPPKTAPKRSLLKRWLLPVFMMATALVGCNPTQKPAPPTPEPPIEKKLDWDRYNALQTEFDDAFGDPKKDFLWAQSLLNQTAEKELFPLLNQVLETLKDHPEQVEIKFGSYDRDDWHEMGADGGRGFRVLFRLPTMAQSEKNPSQRKVSIITFWHYNPTTKKVELVNDGVFTADAFRVLSELPGAKSPDDGIIGASFMLKRDAQDGRITDIWAGDYYTAKREVKYQIGNRPVPGELEPTHCGMCHNPKDSFYLADLGIFQKKVRTGPQDFLTDLTKQSVPPAEVQAVERLIGQDRSFFITQLRSDLAALVSHKIPTPGGQTAPR